MRTPFGIRRRPDTQSLAERHPVVDEVEPAPATVLGVIWEHVEWDTSWDGTWTDRPPSTLQDEIGAIHDAHTAWVLTLPNGGGVIPTTDQDVDTVPYIVPEAS